MISRLLSLLLFVPIFLFLFNINIFAQEFQDTSSNSNSFLKNNFILTGELGAYGEAYKMTGEQNRRPASTGRLYLRPTLTLFQYFSIPMEFFISTEGSGARQDINHYGIEPTWGWGKLYLGDFSENYSDLTLSGINIRGAGINLFPGGFRFAMAAGFTQRAVQGGAENGSYDRFLIAAKTGYGYEDNSHFYLTFLKAKDKMSSLPKPPKSLKMVFPNGNDEIPLNSTQTIRWYSSGYEGNVKILLSRDGGATFETIVENTTNSGFYNLWNVTGTETFSALVKILDVSDSTIQCISAYSFRIGAGIPLKIGNVYSNIENSFASTPQENMLVGINSQLNFLNDMFKIGVEGVGSIYTRDMTADEINIDSAKIPSFIKKIYKPKLSTNIDYAVNSFLNFSAQRVNLRIGYKLIGPGFNSLGTSYLINDQQEINAIASVNLFPVSVFANYGRFNDNIIHQKNFTTLRNLYGAGVTAFVSSIWSTSAILNFMDMGNNSSNDTTKTKFTNVIMSLNNNISFQDQTLIKNLSFNYSYQNSINSSYLMKEAKSVANSLTFTLGLEPLEKLTSAVSCSFVNSEIMDTIKTFSQNYTLTAGYPLLEEKLQNSFSFTASFQSGNKAFNLLLNSSYAITQADIVTLQLGANIYSNKSSYSNSYNEMRTSLNISHRI